MHANSKNRIKNVSMQFIKRIDFRPEEFVRDSSTDIFMWRSASSGAINIIQMSTLENTSTTRTEL